MIHFNDIINMGNEALQVVKGIISRSPMGVVFIIPHDLESLGSTPKLNGWEEIENYLSSQKIDIPVYFSHETKDLNELY